MNTKTFLIVGVIIAVIAGVALFFGGGGRQPDTNGDSSGLIIGKNAIYVAEQAPSKTFSVAVARLEKPGFVVIHEDVLGAPGKILGASGLVPAGETKNLAPIALLRATSDGETLYAMLHLDDGDGAFDRALDKPAKDSVGGEPVMMIVTVSADVTEPGAVNL
ncbi:MAG: hypothetical protein HYT13_01105 [Candidatus Liptonbacteria bacterium]|nr:hypothetical protein [Candidatus Liptonbacteria bacterium]